MKKLVFGFGLLALVSTQPVMAQRACGTDEYNKELTEKMNDRQRQEEFNIRFKEYLKNYDLSQAKVVNRGMGKSASRSYIIPVVVHVMHTFGTENISKTQIQSEIDFLNLSYKRLNDDTNNTRPIFRDIAGVPNVTFRLAHRDPNGKPTDGIVRVYAPRTDRGDDDLKKLSSWDNKRYFNMWVVKKIAREASAGIVAGYAQFPFWTPGGAGLSSTDGVMVNYLYFGQTGVIAPFDAPHGITTTHEAGHWMGLYHPFQGDSCDLENDGIDETPPRYYNSSVGNPNFCNPVMGDSNSCTVDNPDLPDQYENYMDYFTGSCASNMFTAQQVARMHFCLENYRAEMITPENLRNTGVDDSTWALPNPTVPVASFEMYPNAGLNKARACVGKTVNFKDNSYNSTVTAWAWDFGEGATPATSTSQNPTGIVYSTGGWKTISLTVTGPNGTNTITRSNYLYVENASEAISGSVYTADWDYLNDFLDKGWYFENETKNANWVRVTNVKYEGIASLKLDYQSVSPKFTYALVSPSFNMTGGNKPYISFNYAFAPNLTTLKISGSNTTGDSQDGLSVFVSTDCGVTWQQKFISSGNTNNPAAVNPMSTLPSASGTTGVPSTVNFTPTSLSQWKTVAFDGVTNISAAAQVKFKIMFTCQGGNNFYIDNLMMGLNTSLKQVSEEQLHFTMYPNPMSQSATIEYINPEKSQVNIHIYDMLGKEVGEVFNGVQEFGAQQLTIDKQAMHLKAGVYFIKAGFGDALTMTRKFTVN